MSAHRTSARVRGALAGIERRVRGAVRKRLDAASGPVRSAALRLMEEVRISRAARAGARSFAVLQGRIDLRVHLGCGADIRSGWVNVDLFAGLIPVPPPGEDTLVVNHDLRRGLRLREQSCALIYSSHFFEHLSLREGTRLMRDCLQALRVGGVFRVSLPDFRACCAAYLRDDHAFFDLIDVIATVPGSEPGSETLVDAMNYVIYQHGEHRCMYDQEKLVTLLRHVGFSSARKVGFDPGLDRDTEARRRYSLYVEAVR